MSNLSHTQTPPGGWVFTQPQSGWSVPNPVSQTFDQAVILILKHRQANPVLVAKHSLSSNKTAIATELDTFTRTRLGLTPAGMADPPSPGAAPKKSGCCGG